MNLIEGASFQVIGFILIVYNFQIVEPVVFIQKGYQYSASLNPNFVVLFMAGFFFVGAGIAQAAITSTIYNLEKKLFDITATPQKEELSDKGNNLKRQTNRKLHKD
jgi:hypothetical protein